MLIMRRKTRFKKAVEIIDRILENNGDYVNNMIEQVRKELHIKDITAEYYVRRVLGEYKSLLKIEKIKQEGKHGNEKFYTKLTSIFYTDKAQKHITDY